MAARARAVEAAAKRVGEQLSIAGWWGMAEQEEPYLDL